MGFLDKAKQFASKNPDKVDSAVDKAGDMFDAKTEGKYAQHTDTAQDKVGDYLGAGNNDQAGQNPEQNPDQNPEPNPEQGA